MLASLDNLKVERSNPDLKAAHAGASTTKTQHLQPKAPDAAECEGGCFAFSRLASHTRVSSVLALEVGPKPLCIKWLFCEAKRAFPPTWRVLECGKRLEKLVLSRSGARRGSCRGLRNRWRAPAAGFGPKIPPSGEAKLPPISGQKSSLRTVT
jgi:hypothetical protein